MDVLKTTVIEEYIIYIMEVLEILDFYKLLVGVELCRRRKICHI